MDQSDGAWQQASLPIRWGDWGFVVAVMLAPSAYLASAANTTTLVLKLLPPFLHLIPDRSTPNALAAWQSAVEPTTLSLADEAATRQLSWDDPCCQRASTLLLNSAMENRERSHLRASLTATSGAWLQALPISSVGLRMDDDVIRVAVGLRLGTDLCEPHTCTCGVPVDARGTYGLACKQSVGRHPRHGLLNGVVWRAMLRVQVPSCKEPTGLSRSDGKRPDGVSLIPWSRGRCVTWDVSSPDTLAPSHLLSSANQAGSAVARAEAAKTLKYSALAMATPVFVPLPFETQGARGVEAAVFVTELGRRTTAVTGDPRETAFLRQRRSVAIQNGNAIACGGSIPSGASN